MIENVDTIPSLSDQFEKCPQCGHFKRARDWYCPYCDDLPYVYTVPVARDNIVVLPQAEREGNVQFEPDCTAVLQIIQQCTATIQLALAPSSPTVLGRSVLPEHGDLLDLTAFNAFQHGVSRHHCQFERRRNRLVVTDLGSSNGTYLNGEPLLPYKQYIVADGDGLAVGTLQFRVTFDCLRDSS
jgi:hypothetical protein